MTGAAETMMTDYLALATKVYQQYTALMSGHRDGLGGRMLLLAGPGGSSAAAEATVRAANIAGAATLLIEPEDAAARQCVRTGMCDFLVTTLEEALRILKNELRLKQPAAVCLLAEPESALGECVQRGVQPDIFALAPQEDAAGATARTLKHRGAVFLPSLEERGTPKHAELEWASWSSSSQSGRVLPLVDKLAIAALGPLMQLQRQQWLLRSPQYLSLGGRGRGPIAGHGAGVVHTMPMRQDEAASLARLIADAMTDGHLPKSLSLRYGTELLSPPSVVASGS